MHDLSFDYHENAKRLEIVGWMFVQAKVSIYTSFPMVKVSDWSTNCQSGRCVLKWKVQSEKSANLDL